MASIDLLRDELLAWVDGRGAHMPFEAAVADFPDEAINRLPPNVSYTPWHLVEHIRRTQADLLAYIRQDAYVAPEWPAEYWPPADAKATPEEFARSVDGFKADQAALRELVADPATDLLATIPNTPGHTILREVRLAADHTALPRGRAGGPAPGHGSLAARPG